MWRLSSFLSLLLAGFVLASCESRTDKVDGGGVLLSIADFDGQCTIVSVNEANGTAQASVCPNSGLGSVFITQLQLRNTDKDPTGTSSDLMTVVIESYEVRYTRNDSGTRVPPLLVKQISGSVPPNGTVDFTNLPLVGFEQLEGRPLSDLLFENGGFDQETGLTRISLNLAIRFFGRTLSGDAVDTSPIRFTMDFVP